MFGRSEKIYNAYEKPEAAEPTERVVLLREGFSFWAFGLNALWLLLQRMWALLGLYILAVIVLSALCTMLGLSEISVMCVQLWLQLMLGFHAYDAQGWLLKRRGYRFAGVIVAADDIAAERRYYDVVT
jgi:hypothetical protein